MLRQRIRAKLEELAQEKYASFSASLIPNLQEPLLGVRIPMLRKLAKEIIASGEHLEFLALDGNLCFEEKMLKMLIFGKAKLPIDTKLELAENLIGEITNWSLCDTFCNDFKDVALNKARVWEFLKPYWKSANPYAVRVAVVLGLFYFIDEQYLPLLFAEYEAIKHEDYYVKMAVAWGLSMCYVKFEAQTLAFLQGNSLEIFTHNKALQKIRESLQVSKAQKLEISNLKRS